MKSLGVFSTLLENLRSENKIRFGEPWKVKDKIIIIPLFSLENKAQKDYVLIQELNPEDIRVTDTGKIDVLQVRIEKENLKPVFIRVGTPFEGKSTQSRACAISVILSARKGIAEGTISVKCVHASHPIYKCAAFRLSRELIPPKVTERLFSLDQGGVWGEASHLLFDWRGITEIETDNLIEGLGKASEVVKKAVEDIPVLENQVGVIIKKKDLLYFEYFDSPESWKLFHEPLVRSHYLESYNTEYNEVIVLDINELKREFIKLLDEVEKSKKKRVFENRLGKTFVFKSENLIGEFTIFEKKIIHLIALKNAAA